MAAVTEIFEAMDRWAPFETQMDFDNAGFLVGRGGREVGKILVALDITEEVAEEAERWGAQLIVAHHPVIFHPARQITDGTPTGRILLRLIEGGVAAICAHTNLDAAQDGVSGPGPGADRAGAAPPGRGGPERAALRSGPCGPLSPGRVLRDRVCPAGKGGPGRGGGALD